VLHPGRAGSSSVHRVRVSVAGFPRHERGAAGHRRPERLRRSCAFPRRRTEGQSRSRFQAGTGSAAPPRGARITN
jgi:hypothetical protein